MFSNTNHWSQCAAVKENTASAQIFTASSSFPRRRSGSSSGGNTLAASTGSMTVSVGGDTYQAQARNPVAQAWAAPLAASNGTCMGSTSAGAQGVTIGLSMGTTWTDENCNARYDAIAIKALGHERAAWARLCQQPAIRKAYEAAGTPCPSDSTSEKKVSQARPVYVN